MRATRLALYMKNVIKEAQLRAEMSQEDPSNEVVGDVTNFK
jgi:hypothetical protein